MNPAHPGAGLDAGDSGVLGRAVTRQRRASTPRTRGRPASDSAVSERVPTPTRGRPGLDVAALDHPAASPAPASTRPDHGEHPVDPATARPASPRRSPASGGSSGSRGETAVGARPGRRLPASPRLGQRRAESAVPCRQAGHRLRSPAAPASISTGAREPAPRLGPLVEQLAGPVQDRPAVAGGGLVALDGTSSFGPRLSSRRTTWER